MGSDVQIGAMSLVPKNVALDGGRVYVGVPARPLASGGKAADRRGSSSGPRGEGADVGSAGAKLGGGADRYDGGLVTASFSVEPIAPDDIEGIGVAVSEWRTGTGDPS